MYVINHPAIGDLPFMHTPIWIVPRITFFKICLTTVPFFLKDWLYLVLLPNGTKTHQPRVISAEQFCSKFSWGWTKESEYFIISWCHYIYIYTLYKRCLCHSTWIIGIVISFIRDSNNSCLSNNPW